MPLDKVAASTDSEASARIGEVFDNPDDGKQYVLVATSAAIAAAASKGVAYSNAAATTVNVSTTAADPKVAGVIPAGLDTVSATAGTLDSGDIFWLQTGGIATPLSAAAIANGAAVGLSTTAGKVDDANITFDGVLGIALEAATGADERKQVLLKTQR